MTYAIEPKSRADEDKLAPAIHKLMEEDLLIRFFRDPQTNEFLIAGAGQPHIEAIVSRLKKRYHAEVTLKSPKVPYLETIRAKAEAQGRHKKQSGGHGQYGDVVLDIKPLPRGAGFVFEDKITGGVVPRNYIPSVEEGVIDALKHGPLGFPVVDLHVSLIDGSYHTVDSSDMAFRTAGRIGVVEGLPQCQPVLLEPIHLVEIVCPNEATAKINALMSGRRGQILGFDTREGWDGWDVVRAKMPEAEIGDLIVEVRSATAGAGTFTFKFDHMAELTGRTADQIIAARRAAE
jgi:elongation factor G